MTNKKTKKSSLKKDVSTSSSGSVRDIKIVSNNKSDFVIKDIDPDDIPFVDPLDEDVVFDDVDIDYEPVRPLKMNIHPVKDIPKTDSFVSDNSVLSSGGSSGGGVSAVTSSIRAGGGSAGNLEGNIDESLVKDLIKVKFSTFVSLIANRDLEDVFESNSDQQIIMNSNLLTELASSKDRREDKKIPIVFLIGIAIGIVLTYIFFST